MIDALHQRRILSLKGNHQPADNGVKRPLPIGAELVVDRQRLIVRAVVRLAVRPGD
ncbi:MAG: hypothetical protein AB7G35_14065 [Hyphomicrobiaceae bacterium]